MPRTVQPFDATPVHPLEEHLLGLTRRQLFRRAAVGVGVASLTSLLNPSLFAATGPDFSPYCDALRHLSDIAPGELVADDQVIEL